MARTQTYTYTLPRGTVIYIENDESGERGARKVRKARETRLPFSNEIRPIGEVAELAFEAVKSQVVNPDNITLEFGATLKGAVDTEATFKVSLAWERKERRDDGRPPA